MKKNIKLNYIFNAGYKLFTIIVPLITAPYVSRVLGAEGVGTYSYTFSIVSYFTMVATLGGNAFGNRHIAIYQNDPHGRSVEFWNIAIFRAVPTVIVTILYFLYVIFIAEDKTIAALQSLYLFGVLFDVGWFLQGLENFQTVAIRNFIFKIINIACIFLFVKSRDDLPIYILCLGGLTALGNLSLWPYVKKYLIKINPQELNPMKNAKAILQLFFPTIACGLYAIVDKTMIGLFSCEAENGYYEQADKIINMSLMLITALSAVMLPRIAAESSRNNTQAVKAYITKACHFVWLLGLPLAFGLIGISEFFVPIFFGEGYDKVKILLPVMSCLFILKGLNDTIGYQYLVATNQQNKYTQIIVIGGLANIVFNLILIPQYYSLGAAIGSIIGEVVTCALEFAFVSRSKQIELKPIFKSSLKNFISAATMLAFVLIIKYFTNSYLNNIFTLLGVIIVAAVVYFIVLIILKDSLVMSVLNPILNKLKNKIHNGGKAA